MKYKDLNLTELSSLSEEHAIEMKILKERYEELTFSNSEIQNAIVSYIINIFTIESGNEIKIDSDYISVGIYNFRNSPTIKITKVTPSFIYGKVISNKGLLLKYTNGILDVVNDGKFQIKKKFFVSMLVTHTNYGKQLEREMALENILNNQDE